MQRQRRKKLSKTRIFKKNWQKTCCHYPQKHYTIIPAKPKKTSVRWEQISQ